MMSTTSQFRSDRFVRKTSDREVAVSVTLAVAKACYKSKLNEVNDFEDFSDGENITLDEASELKTLCWGAPTIPPRNIWLKQGFVLHQPEKLFAYGLKAPENGTKNLLMVVQAHFLKHLFFPYEIGKGVGGNRRRTRDLKSRAADKPSRIGSIKTNQILHPNASTQQEMVANGLAGILEKASSGGNIVVAVKGSEDCFEMRSNYGIDGHTEKMKLFRCKTVDEARKTIRRFLPGFMKDNGVGLLCFLYSLILTRGFQRVQKDLQDEVCNPLIDMHGETSLPLINLALLGMATPYLHNGTTEVIDENGKTQILEGVTERSEIGALVWDTDPQKTSDYKIGAMLKTPIKPLWVTYCNGRIGVLFNPNKDLLKTHDAEKRFKLYYYSNKDMTDGAILSETKLTIEACGKTDTRPDVDFDNENENSEPPLECLVKTKWPEAKITWNIISPYF